MLNGVNVNLTSTQRSESMAYASANPASDLWSRLIYHIRFNTKVFVGGVGLVLVALVLIVDGMGGGRGVSTHGGLRL